MANTRRNTAKLASEDLAQPVIRQEHVPPAAKQPSRNVASSRSLGSIEEVEPRMKKQKTNEDGSNVNQ